MNSGESRFRLLALDKVWHRCDAPSVMPKRSSKRKKRPVDVNRLATSIVDDATSEAADEPTDDTPADDGKNPAAVALGRLGGLKGGKARAKKLTKAERVRIAKRAADARWKPKQE